VVQPGSSGEKTDVRKRRIRSQYWVGTYKLTFFSDLREKNSLIVKNFLSVAKMAWTVYETENCHPDAREI